MAKKDINISAEHQPVKKPKKLKWFQKQITADQFVTRKGKNGKFYGHHTDWKSKIWMGPYDTEEELNKVIASYASTTKKPFGQRKEIKNLHSVIIEENEF